MSASEMPTPMKGEVIGLRKLGMVDWDNEDQWAVEVRLTRADAQELTIGQVVYVYDEGAP